MRLTLTEAEALSGRVLEAAGVPPADARRAARILAMAEAMGIATHGLGRTITYADRIAAGGINPASPISLSSPAPALRRVDGGGGLGPVIVESARDAVSEAARELGIAAGFVHGGSHFGALAPYLYLAAKNGFAAVLTTNTAAMVAPAGETKPRIGNNPVGLAIPHPQGRHVILDMALTRAARSRIRAAAAEGRAIPDSWALDSSGRPTTDPDAAMRGLLQAIGGAKGAHLALMVDLMAAGLSGAAMLDGVPNANETPGIPQNLGHLLILIDVARLMAPAALGKRIDDAARTLAETPGTDPDTCPRLPGARALACYRRARTSGLEVPCTLLNELRTRGAG